MEVSLMIQRGRRRLTVRRIIQKCALCVGISIFVCAVILACIRFGVDVPGWCWGIAAIPLACLLIWAWPWRFSDIEIARQIDASNQFGDRISSAMAFMKEEKRTEWMEVQIKDTEKKIQDPAVVDGFLKKAFQIGKPQHIKVLAGLVVVSAFIVFLPDIVHAISSRIDANKANAVAQDEVLIPNLDAVSQELRQDQVEKLLEAAEELDDSELKEAAEELAQILKDDREGKLTREEFERRLAELEKKIAESEPITSEEQKAFDQAVKDAVESMTQMKEDPETKELAEALEQNDYDKAADILKDLLNSANPEDKKKLEKLAKMFGDLAKNLDPTDPKLKEALKKNKDLIDQLKKELDNEKLSDEDRKAFSEAAKKLQDAEKEQKNLEQQKQTQQQKANNQAGQALDKLSKAMDKTSKSLDDKAQEKAGESGKEGEKQQDGQQGQQQQGQQQDGRQGQQQQGQQQDGRQGQQQQGQQQDGRQGQQQQGQQQDGQQGQQQQGQQQDGQQGQQQQGQQQDGQQGQQQDGQQGQQQQGQQGQQQQSDDAGQNGAQSAEQALREAAKNKNAQQKRDELRDLAEKMRQDASQSGEESNEQASERQKNMQDFMDRAKGQDKEAQQQQNDQQQGQQAGEQNKGQQQDGEQGDQQGMKGQMQQGLERADDGKGEFGQPNSEKDGLEKGSEPGKGHDTTEGDATSMAVDFKDEKLKGQDAGEQTTGKIIESAGQQGFASEPYREVYQTYEKAAEEILESEEVPQGYRNYINKYFDMIRPQ